MKSELTFTKSIRTLRKEQKIKQLEEIEKKKTIYVRERERAKKRGRETILVIGASRFIFAIVQIKN